MAHLPSRFTLFLLAMITACATWAQSIFIDGHKAVHDINTDRWLCSVPREVFGTDWEATVTIDDSWSTFIIDGMAALTGDIVTFYGIEGGKEYAFSAIENDTTRIRGTLTFTWLPLLELNGEFGDEYNTGTVSLLTPDTASSKSDMLAKLKWRGGITNSPNKHKRNYHIKFIDENGEKKNRRLLGMRKDNHWKLDGGQMDLLRIRNRVCSDLWLDMARDPWHKALDSTVVNGSHGRITEMFLNGQYYGIYNLMEPLDRKQLGLVKHDTIAGVFHGQQWASKLKNPTYILPPYDNNSESWNGNSLNYPEMEDVSPTDWSTLYNAFEFARRMDAVDNWQTLADSIGYYFDVPVMQDYLIFIVALQALDNEVKNIYYSCYDKQLDPPLLVMTPWDLDICLGSQSIVGLDVSPERPVDWIMHLAMGDMFHFSPVHRPQIIERYWQLRQTWLSTESLLERFQNAVDELEQCGAAAREEQRWSQDSDLGGKVLDISQEMTYIANWITRRMAYLDENVFVRNIVLGDVDDDGFITINDVTTLINYLLTDKETINEVNADVNEDGFINIGDVTELINLLLKGE